jgi:hypothetical protein
MQKTVADVFGIKQPAPYKSKQNPDKTNNDSLLCGLELEVEHLPNGHAWYMDNAGNFWSVVEDGSLRPRGEAWEFVSRPATLGVALAELRHILEKMKWDERNYSDRCSVHVHTNVLDMTQAQVANLALVYPVIEAVLFQFVNHYKCKDKQGYCRDTNLYCIPWSDCRMNRNFIEKFFANPAMLVPDRRGLGTRAWEKYTALNFKPIGEHGTVEWRHMHGTADMEKLTKWLNMIGSIMKFCKEQEFMDIVKTIKVLNDVSTYQQFFQSVLGGNLEYKEEYRAPMAEGVVNAKYSLINWEANKDKPKKPVLTPPSATGEWAWTAGALNQGVDEPEVIDPDEMQDRAWMQQQLREPPRQPAAGAPVALPNADRPFQWADVQAARPADLAVRGFQRAEQADRGPAPADQVWRDAQPATPAAVAAQLQQMEADRQARQAQMEAELARARNTLGMAPRQPQPLDRATTGPITRVNRLNPFADPRRRGPR